MHKSSRRLVMLTPPIILVLSLFAATVNAQDEGSNPVAIEPITPLTVQVDQVFANLVQSIESVLFYRVFSGTRQYIEYAEVDYYRNRGATGPYVKLQPQSAGPGELNQIDVERLAALSRLTRAPGPGVLNNTPVEYLTIRLGTGRFIRDADGNYRAQSSRERLSDTQVLSDQEVRDLADQGLLQENPVGEDPKYLLVESHGGAPLVVLWLSVGAVIFTVVMGGYNFWGFRHALEIVRGRYDNPNEPGEVTHFQALSSALSATVGLGNIAGVTIAMTTGGPGAFFWMLACGFFGMSSKFVECTLGQKYRQVKPDGTVLGGPMQYLHVGLKELGLGPIGLVLSIVFAVMCILASFGGGNMFQANQSGSQVLSVLQGETQNQLQEVNRQMRQAARDEDDVRLTELRAQRLDLENEMKRFELVFRPVYGIILAIFVALVIIGGIKRIGAAASKIVPSMCLLYLLACVFIIVTNINAVPALVASIFTEAFTPAAFGGGLLGVLVVGVQRAAFSNEAGVGSAAIAHSAARTEEPVREGTVALLGPFIDTIVVCSMTALVVLITDAWQNTEWTEELNLEGAALTTRAFAAQIWWFPYVLMVAVVLFAYSTLISWSYYGERCWERLFGNRSTIVYRFMYVGAVFVGAIVNLGSVLAFSDMMILSMAFPNIFGAVLLSPRVRRDLMDYWRRYKANEFKIYR